MKSYLEATCGHEFECPPERGFVSETDCPEHGRVGLWAERLEPSTDDYRPLPSP